MDGYPLVKVLDFGVSKMLEASVVRRAGDDPSVSVSGSLVGTPLYMSPEQIRTPSTVDGRSDVWSLGVILYELVTGRQPFGGETVADVIASILVDAPVAPSALRVDVPDQLSQVILACLEKDVDRRCGNVGILAEGLRPWAPRWARDSAVRAARIAGERRLGLDDTGPYKTANRDTGSAELPAVSSDAPGPSADPTTGADARRGALAVARETRSGPGPFGVSPGAAVTVASSSRGSLLAVRGVRIRQRHLGWMALGFGSAVALLVTLLNVVPRAVRAPDVRRPESVEVSNLSGNPKALTAPNPKPPSASNPKPPSASNPKPLTAPSVSPELASQPSALDPDSRRSDARSTVLPAATELVGERRSTAGVGTKPHRVREATSSARDRSAGAGARPATGQLADPLGTRR
jgi:serine/threonine-protein kinase